MLAGMEAEDLGEMRFTDRVISRRALALEAGDRETGAPGQHTFRAAATCAPMGAKLIWGTATRSGRLLGDTSDDYNWYTKRATLAGVYGATVLYWLGDDSREHGNLGFP